MRYFFFLLPFILNTALNSQWHSQSINATGYFGVVHFANDSVGWMSSNNPSKIYKTTNGGETWYVQHETDGPIISIFFLDENNGWFTDMDSNGGRLAFTSNGGNNWVLRYPADGFWFHSLYFFDVNNGIAGGSAYSPQVGTIFRTTDGGSSWVLQHIGFYPNALFFLNNSIGWCGGTDGSPNMLKTTDGGINWTPLSNNLQGGILRIQFFNDMMGWINVSSSSAYNKLYFTTDGGISWNLNVDAVNDFWFTDMNTGWYFINDNIFHTTNAGADWSLQHSDSGKNLLSLYFYNQNLGWAAGYDGYILHTNNGGTPVELVSFSASVQDNNINLHWITASELNNYGFEVQRKIAKHVENNNWEVIGFVEGNGTTTELIIYSFYDRNLSEGKYTYRLRQIDYDGTFEYSVEIEVFINSPSAHILEQNYPNPFNPVTKIKFTIPQKDDSFIGKAKGSLVTLRVFDLLGKEIAVLINEEKLAGTYEVDFNGSNFSSGAYYYRIQVDNFIKTKKLLLLK
jgi:photosystem II stability/assembly factor-like uncharacterized protein